MTLELHVTVVPRPPLLGQVAPLGLVLVGILGIWLLVSQEVCPVKQ